MPRSLEVWLARAAVEQGLLDRAQLEAARLEQEHERPAPPLGVVLVERGLLSHAQVHSLLAACAGCFSDLEPQGDAKLRAWDFAARAVESGAATPAKVNHALREQSRREEEGQPWAALGRILIQQGVLTELQAAALIRASDDVAGSGAEAAGGGGGGERPADATLRVDGLPAPLAAPLAASLSAPTVPATPTAQTLAADAPPQPSDGPAGRATARSTPAASPASAAVPEGRAFGKYVLVRELGRGGMGVVYHAYDTQLRRDVALKTLHLGDAGNPDMVERLLREARTAGTLDHPGIVQVHDVGAVDGTPYFAMTYVEGRTLHALLREGALATLRARTLVLREVAEAVAHAHERRVVHRDLKPANVLIDGAGRVHVMDFGIAKRLDEGAPLTATGQMLGTPQYMPPEQIDGDLRRVGPATDVYALGAILYEALTGRPPFPGDTVAEIIAKALAGDPVPPRRLDRRVPADLETICLKALRREPERRYPTARELAHDLARHLDGEAIDARPETWWQKGTRWVQRRKATSAAAALGLAALATAAVTGYQVHVARADRERLAREVLASVREIGAAYLKSALHARRAGAPLSSARADFLPALERAVRRAVEQAPALAEPHYHLGRMHRALLRFEDALRQQEEALRKEPDYAPSRYEHAILTARGYEERLTELRAQWRVAEGARLAAGGRLAQGGLGGAQLRALPADDDLVAPDAAARDLRASLRRDLERLQAAAARAPAGTPAVPHTPIPDDGADLTPGMLECARGLALHYAGRPDDRTQARALLTRALERERTLEEACESLADLELAAGDPDQAIAVYGRGIEVDRGYAPYFLGRAWVLCLAGALRAETGGDPSDLYTRSEADYTRALDLTPDSVPGWIGRGELYRLLGNQRVNHGQDPAIYYTQAGSDYGQALGIDPNAAQAWSRRGDARANWGLWQIWQGQDPTRTHAQAEADYDRAIELKPNDAVAWRSRGMLRTNWGQFVAGRGQDPSTRFRAAETDLGQALTLDPGSADTWMRRGLLRMNWGSCRFERGEDPEETYRNAEADCGKALELAPNLPEAWRNRANLRMNWAICRAQHRQDAATPFSGAASDLERALQLSPGSADTWSGLALVHSAWGTHRMEQGEDPTDLFTRSEGEFAKAVGINPGSAEIWTHRGTLLFNWGTRASRQGQDAAGLFTRADESLTKAIALNDRAADAWLTRANLRFEWGCDLQRRGEDPAPRLAAAHDDYERAVTLNPASAEARWRRGMFYCGTARWALAIADFADAGRLNPASEPIFRTWLAQARRNQEAASGTLTRFRGLAALAHADQVLGAGDYPAAGKEYEAALDLLRSEIEALPAEQRPGVQRDPRVQQAVLNAHYNLACVYALGSAGRTGSASPNAPAVPPPADEAARLRDRAFGDLDVALRLGFRDGDHLRADPDLAPLHDDPRWAEIEKRSK